MLLLKYLLLIVAVGGFVVAAAIVLFDVYLLTEYRRRLALASDQPLPIPQPIRWKAAARLAVLTLLPLLFGLSIVVVPSGMAAVRVSQLSGTQQGTLYPGVHFVKPLLETIAIYDVRDQIYSTSAEAGKKQKE